MKYAALITLLLVTLSACEDHNGWGSGGVTVILLEGDKRDPNFSTLSVAFVYTLRDVGGIDRVFLDNPATGTTLEASLSDDPEFPVDGDSFGSSTDARGELVAFLSVASNLLFSGPTAGTLQAYLRDLVTGDIILVSQNDFGEEANAPVTSVQVAGNGRFVVFATAATNLLPAATNGFSQIYLYDDFLGTLSLISMDDEGTPGNGGSIRPAITPDGRQVVFQSGADNLLAGDANGIADIYLYDRTERETERISAAGGGMFPVMSQDALFVIFERDVAGVTQLFCRDRGAMATAQMTAGNDDSTSASISADGRFTVFQSDATDLVAGDTNGHTDVFVFDFMGAKIVRVSVGPAGEEGDDDSRNPSILADGRLIAFESLAFNIADLDPSGFSDIFLFQNPFLQ